MKPVVIHGDLLGGYSVPIFFAVFVVGMPGTAILERVWLSRPSVEIWLMYWAILAVTAVTIVVVARRTFIEATPERVRWFFRQPRAEGDEPLGNLVKVSQLPSAAILVFRDTALTASLADFARRDIRRLVEALRDFGVSVDPSAAP